MGLRGPRARPLEERFWPKVNKNGPMVRPDMTPCWIWTASRNFGDYGQIGITRSRSRVAHRVSWELHFGPIPDGMDVLHRCDNPPCVNPEHLWLGTQGDNNADKLAKGREGWSGRPWATHCSQGHLLDAANIYWSRHRSGQYYRRCRICTLARVHARRTSTPVHQG